MSDRILQHPESLAQLNEVAEALGRSSSVLVITGAGMSADSGVPTYRGIAGLYEEQKTEHGISIEKALSASVFTARPEITWTYLRQIEGAARGAGPHEGHRVLASLEEKMDRVVVLTQNVDGFHGLAGSSKVIEMHGNLHRIKCTRCDFKRTVADYSLMGTTPGCPECGAWLRPEVVLFEEALPRDAIASLEQELAMDFDLVMMIGTTASFPYIAEPVLRAARFGLPTVEINPVDSAVSEVVRIHVRERALPALVALQGFLRKN